MSPFGSETLALVGQNQQLEAGCSHRSLSRKAEMAAPKSEASCSAAGSRRCLARQVRANFFRLALQWRVAVAIGFCQ